MTKVTLLLAAMFLACGTVVASSQTQPPPSGPVAAPEAAPAPGAPPAVRPRARGGKRFECRQIARQKGLRGEAARNDALICVQEARTECLKQAVAQNVPRHEQKEFIKRCLNGQP